MISSASVGVLIVLLRVIACLVLFLISCVYADHSPALQSPKGCFDDYPGDICLMSVKYPVKRWYSCGYPGLEVDCNFEVDGKAFINISNHTYHVNDISYESNEIRLVDIDVEGSGCPRPKRNFSFPSSPSWVNYHLSGNYDNITIFYNCSSVPVYAEYYLLCSKDDTNTSPSYAFSEYDSTNEFDWYGNCTQNVVVPVEYTGTLNYSDAIKDGVVMGWSATDWCEDCERSGGHCWSNSTATGCACTNGKSYNTTCPALTSPPPPPPRHKGVPPTPSTALKSQHRKDGLSIIVLKIVIGVLSGIGVVLLALLVFFKCFNHSSLNIFPWQKKK